MPGKDRTFSAKDVIRIFNHHLDFEEQGLVLLDLCRGVKIEVFDEIARLVPVLAGEEAIEETDLIENLITIISGGRL